MKTIWKYSLSISRPNYVNLPKDAAILHFAMQKSQLCMWAKVDTEAPKIKTKIFVLGTGHEIPPNSLYLGTIQDDVFMWHIFEEEQDAS